MRAVRAHGADQRARARHQRDAIDDHVIDDGDRQAFQQRHALTQRRLECDFAPHRALGDRRYVILQADQVGQFVDTFLTDHG